MQARVYDGSDTGAKIFATMSVIGKEATKPAEDAQTASALSGIRRWPVVISYFNEAATDAPPEYTLSFDLYENGVSGSLKLDYGAFALRARLRKLEIFRPRPAPNRAARQASRSGVLERAACARATASGLRPASAANSTSSPSSATR